MVLRDLISPGEDVDDAAKQLESDLKILQGIKTTWYLRGHTRVIKSGQLHLAWDYAQNPEDHQRFINMLWVSPGVFQPSYRGASCFPEQFKHPPKAC